MKSKKYSVNVYFSGFCTHEVEAKDEADAIGKARELSIDEGSVLSSLESWPEADEVVEAVVRKKL